MLYLCPLRALLNNVEPRLSSYAQWMGRSVGLWHGDTTSGRRERMRQEPPDILLTTPESLEAMLISTRMRPREFFAGLQTVIVDEVHAFAGDDRGWHLLAVLERLQRVAGRPLQRVGLSATVGNPTELLAWLQGSGAGIRPGTVVAPDVVAHPGPEKDVSRPPGDVTLDHVGSVTNAATVIAALHQGEKRLVFCESRRTVEDMALALRERGVETFVSHSSLSLDERRRAEQAFSEVRDCVIVSTSTLELGIDVGDLDRVIQVDAPRSVASFLQRLGRTGRRAGTTRNALLLTTDDDALLQAAGLLHLWAEGFVEPVVPPPSPRHIVAQQLLALCLQEGRVGDQVWPQWWSGLAGLHDETTSEIVEWLVSSGHLENDAGMLFIGPETERRYGRKHFLDLVSVFTASPEFLVLHGRSELGSVDPLVLTRKTEGPRIVVLAGRSWTVTYIDWRRRRCFVEASDARVRMRWTGEPAPLSFELCQAQRRVTLGTDPAVTVSKRAVAALARLREERAETVTEDATVVTHSADTWWWTWAGAKGNATLAAALAELVDPKVSYDNIRLRLRTDLKHGALSAALVAIDPTSSLLPQVTPDAVRGLKFADVLPPSLAQETAAQRLADPRAVQSICAQRVRSLRARPPFAS